VVISRRWFLIGGASAAVLAACGGDDDSSGPPSTTDATLAGLTIYRVFSPQQPAGGDVRLPVALADAEGGLLDEPPASITYRYGLDGGPLGDPVEAARHDDGIPTAYFPLFVTLDEVGSWRIEITAGGVTAATSLQAVPPNETAAVPAPGTSLIPLATPTVDDPRGVDPVCTREPPCPFHAQTLEAALESGKPVAFLISTPMFCQTAICGPVLDLLVERADELGDDLAIVHAEVYTDDTARTTTEAVQAYGLTWEPSLFLARPGGTIVSRLDYTYDAVEVDRALRALLT